MYRFLTGSDFPGKLPTRFQIAFGPSLLPPPRASTLHLTPCVVLAFEPLHRARNPDPYGQYPNVAPCIPNTQDFHHGPTPQNSGALRQQAFHRLSFRQNGMGYSSSTKSVLPLRIRPVASTWTFNSPCHLKTLGCLPWASVGDSMDDRPCSRLFIHRTGQRYKSLPHARQLPTFAPCPSPSCFALR